MRRITIVLLLSFAFSIPWEYSLDLGEPWGNIARLAGLAVLLAAIPTALLTARLRPPGPMQWLVLALYLWFCCTWFWSVDPSATLAHLRGNFQEMMIVWLLWEFIETPLQLRAVLAAFVAGSCLLALLTLANFGSAQAIATDQIRFAAEGHDPNDAARLLVLSFPLAVLLFSSAQSWVVRLVALIYLPLGLFALLLTGSRGGLLGAVVALAASAFLLLRHRGGVAKVIAFALPALIVSLWLLVPGETFDRLATIPAQLQSGDLNQRWNIWYAGWHAFAQAPWFGSGIGAFTVAAGTNPLDTAHNTALSLLVGGGLIALFLSTAILAVALKEALSAPSILKGAFASALLVWGIGSLAGTVEENRATWLFLGLTAVAGRLAVEDRLGLEACFNAIRPEPSAGSSALPANWAD